MSKPWEYRRAPRELLRAWKKDVLRSRRHYPAPGNDLKDWIDQAEDYASEWWTDEWALQVADNYMQDEGGDDPDMYLSWTSSDANKFAETVSKEMAEFIMKELEGKLASRIAQRWARSEKTALVKTKNKRVFLDLRGGTLILDFRGDSGMRALDPRKLQNMYRDFFIDVVNTEKNVGLPSTSKGHSSIEVYKNELGFHVQRWYKWDGIAEQLGWDFDAGGEEYSTGDLVDALADALSGAGWKVTPA